MQQLKQPNKLGKTVFQKCATFTDNNRHKYKGQNQKCFAAGETSWNRDTSINVSCTTHKRKDPQGNILDFISKILLKLHFK